MQAVTNQFRNYYNHTPAGTADAAAKGFVYCFAAVVVYGLVMNPGGASLVAIVTSGVRTGLVSALATAVHSATAPLIRPLMDGNNIPLLFEVIRRGVEWHVTAALASLHPAFRINLYATIVLGTALMVLNALFNQVWEYNLNQPAIFAPLLETVMDNRHHTPNHWR